MHFLGSKLRFQAVVVEVDASNVAYGVRVVEIQPSAFM
jgi:hypothetical protein